MDNNQNNRSDNDSKKGNSENDRQKQQNENNNSESNANFDIAQRRHQAKPRSYASSVDSENVDNQNTEADKEQTDRAEGDFGYNNVDGRKIGDKVSERQQRIDDNNPQNPKK